MSQPESPDNGEERDTLEPFEALTRKLLKVPLAATKAAEQSVKTKRKTERKRSRAT